MRAATTGELAVDVFYVRDDGALVDDPRRVAGLDRTLASALTAIRFRVVEESAVAASDVLRWAETLSAIARTGLGFTQSLYEQERFEEVLKVASDIRAAAIDEAEAEALYEEWLSTVGEGVAGYVTPKVAVAAIVGNEHGRAPAHPALRQRDLAVPGRLGRRRVLAVRDRGEGGATRRPGIEVEPVSLITVLDGLRLGFARIPMYSLVFHCRMLGGELRGHPLETRAVGFFPRDALPAAARRASTVGVSSRSAPSTASSSRPTSTCRVRRPGARADADRP